MYKCPEKSFDDNDDDDENDEMDDRIKKIHEICVVTNERMRIIKNLTMMPINFADEG